MKHFPFFYAQSLLTYHGICCLISCSLGPSQPSVHVQLAAGSLLPPTTGPMPLGIGNKLCLCQGQVSQATHLPFPLGLVPYLKWTVELQEISTCMMGPAGALGWG